MARLVYKCDSYYHNESTEIDSDSNKPIACTHDNYCLYCCCNPQCCLLVQRRPPRHLWEAWYFWLGIALLVVFVICSVSSYIVSNYRHNIQGIPIQYNAGNNNRNERPDAPRTNQNEISISVIPTSGMIPPHRKMLIIASKPNVTHMTPVVA